jgi:hypothetical protein
MRIQNGIVTSLDVANDSGIIIENKTGKEFVFTVFECKNDVLPNKGERVSFVHDTD